MNRLLVICGPTATGKTSLGISLAKKFNGEIISADSRQVYRGMDIITGKDIPEFSNKKGQEVGYYEINGIKIWLYDVIRPDQRFNVADYYELAWKVIKDIWDRGKLPIIVGGTGFYIKTLLERIGTMGIGPDWELRDQLSHHSIASLLDTLEKLDPERSRRMNESDRSNPRRLVRAIEVATKLKTKNLKLKTKNLKLDYLLIGLTAPNEILYKRIDQRVDE
ncbi:tRNA (adenosine(37)-N6)-dimethylallyltransferase MiaA, partial [Patescibacteria group bacterium]|nr:tRNA (adenosine(37)-N6)-dimethylallyltransferase MiaA [Patescibacteria group bacterium]